MKVSIEQAGIQTVAADAVIVNLFQGVTEPGGATGAVNQALDGAISQLIAGGDIQGKAGETAVLYPRGAIKAQRVIVAGLGPADQFDLEGVREASGTAIKLAQKLGAANVATIVHGAGIGGLDAAAAAQAVVEGSLLALYQYDAPGLNKDNGQTRKIERLRLVEFDGSKTGRIEAGARAGQIIAEAVSLARTLTNQPSNVVTPSALAEAARAMCVETGLTCRVLGENEMREAQMGALLAVAQGAVEPARFIIMEHKPAGFKNQAGPIVLVGKGITFDTGGYSLKTGLGMVGMKGDMGGAAAVIGTMRAAAQLKLPLHLIGLVPGVENVISATAYKPNDVFIAKNGVSIEIISTDAEGRMVLADALCYADTLKPGAVIDIATLTGGKIIALGKRTDALFSNDDRLCESFLAASRQTAEPMWRLPLDPAYDRQIKSDVADIKNSGGPNGSALTAARFLAHFVGDWPWLHVDIAGSEFYTPLPEQTPRSYVVKGATGVPLRTLVAYLRNQA